MATIELERVYAEIVSMDIQSMLIRRTFGAKRFGRSEWYSGVSIMYDVVIMMKKNRSDVEGTD